MDADERLTALKKAYADVILNTSKEAAARVIAAEQKALHFEHELNATKEQALQMLLRLKQMTDSKVRTAEMTNLSQQRKIEHLTAQLQEAEDTISETGLKSLSQQRKIEELEAQLEEAEDIVTELREDLAEVRAELDSVRKSKLQHEEFNLALQENKLNTPEPVKLAPESRVESFTASGMKNSGLDHRDEVHKCLTTITSRTEDGNVSKPQPCRIRRVQRIRAFEEKLMAGELFSGPTDDVNYQASGRDVEECEKVSNTTALNQVRRCNFSQGRTRKATKYKKIEALSSRHLPNQAPGIQTFNKLVSNASSAADPSSQGPKLSEDMTRKGKSLESTKFPGSDTEFVKRDSFENAISSEKASTVSSLMDTLGTNDRVPSQILTGRVIKYTFQRKRKKDSLSSSEGNASLEQGPLRKNAKEKPNGPPETKKYGTVTEPS